MSTREAIIKTVLEISERRGETLRQLREALTQGDDKKALPLARQLCGLDDERDDKKGGKQ